MIFSVVYCIFVTADCDAKGCQQICVNDPLTGPVCRCGDGYILNETDQITCIR